MDEYMLIKKSTLTGIADAIREKEESSESIPVPDLKPRIQAIETGVDTSDATAAASDIASGKTAYANEKKITGTVNETKSGQSISASGSAYLGYGTGYLVGASYQFPSDRIFRAGSTLHVSAPASDFGDATAADVAAGMTFTSAAGLKIVGTLESNNYKHVNFGDSDVSISIDSQGNSQIKLSDSSITASSQIVAIDFGASISKRTEHTYISKTKSATHVDYNASTTHEFYCEFSGESGSVVPIVENGALVLHLVDFGGFYNCLSDENLLDAVDWYYFDCQFVFMN